MRTNEERIAAMHTRAEQLNKEYRRKRVRVLQAVSAAACFAVIVMLSVFIPGLSGALVPQASSADMSASIFSGSRLLECAVIGILAFLLGVSVTIFCFRLKKREQQREDGK